MKKKITAIISVIALTLAMTLALVACNSATAQGQLENPLGYDHKYETFVYDALDTYDGSTGTYTVRLEAFERGASIDNFGDEAHSLKDLDAGVLVTGELRMGEYTSLTGCYFKLVGSSSTYMVPMHSYTVHLRGSEELFRLQAYYSGGNFNYERTISGTTDKGALKVSGTYFDNNEFHQMLRTVSTYSSGLSLAYRMPLVNEKEAAVLDITAVSNSTTQKVKTAFTDSLEILDSEGNKKYADGMPCYVVNISRSTKVPGVSQTLYYAVDNISVDPDYPSVRALKNALIKIVEPYKRGDQSTLEDGTVIRMEYTLRTAVPEKL